MLTKTVLGFSPLLILLSVTIFRAMFLYKPQPEPEVCADSKSHHRIKLTDEIVQRFKGALNFKTISTSAGNYDRGNLQLLIDYIAVKYPNLHSSAIVRKEVVAGFTLIYKIEGTNEKLLPYMLTSHLDVVPVVQSQWSHDAFDAVVKEDRHIYARGTIDAKNLVFAILESLEHMIGTGFRLKRSIYLVFGHDEEISGVEGAQTVAKLLSKRLKTTDARGNKFLYILDEGTIISKTRFPGIEANIGLVGVVEKGYATVRLSASGSVGHGSMPPPQTAISKLSQAVGKFHSFVYPNLMGYGVEREMIEIFAKHSSWPMKYVYANFWLFKPIFSYIFASDLAMNALIRTTTAVTMIEGGTKENVLPDSASAVINHRMHSMHSVDYVLARDREIINDPSIKVELWGHATNSTRTAPYCDTCAPFQLIKRSVQQVYPGTVVVPATFLAASDSRWYQNLTEAIYKFSAIAVPLEEMQRFHGHDERISLENYENLINFFHHLIINSDADKFDFIPKSHEEL